MAWPEWNLDIPQEVARFVHPTAALRAGLRPQNAGDLADDPPLLVEAIYERLREERLGYTSTVLGERGNQVVQTPGEVLEHRTPNCVDLSVLMAATALACDLVPLIAIVKKADNTRHAFVWIVPNASTRARRSTDLGPVGGTGHVVKVGIAECAALVDVAKGQGWIGVETTGVSLSRIWAPPDSDQATSIDLQTSIDMAAEVVAGATRIDLVDVHRLQADGLRPHEPPELAAIRRRRNRSLLGAASAVVLVSAALVWSPWSAERIGQAKMTGGFNIALAELSADGGLGDEAREIPRQLAADVARSLEDDTGAGIGRFQVWGPDDTGVPALDGASDLAAAIDADMLVYGSVNERGARSLDVDLAVDASQHSAKAPWPMTISEEFTTVVDTADVEAGTLGNVPAISAFGLTLDAITALVADRFDRADERLQAAADRLGTEADSFPLIPALRAWLLLVQAGASAQPELVAEARPFIDAALRADPDSEFARLIEFSADYLAIIPVPSSQVVATCGSSSAAPADPPPRPAVSDVRALVGRLEAALPSFSERGQVQVRSLLGRLAFAEQLDVFVNTGSLDLDAPTQEFEAIIDAFDNAPDSIALTIWAADAHGWLGNLAGISTSTTATEIAAHYLRAAQIATPLFQSRHYGSAALVHCTRPDGSLVESVCLFTEAADVARGRADDDAATYRSALDEIQQAQQDAGSPPLACPSDWEVATP